MTGYGSNYPDGVTDADFMPPRFRRIEAELWPLTWEGRAYQEHGDEGYEAWLDGRIEAGEWQQHSATS